MICGSHWKGVWGLGTKKAVATLRIGEEKKYAKVIKTERSPKTGAYVFKEIIVPDDMVKDTLTKK